MITGKLDVTTGIFTADDKTEYHSIGCIDYGNNNFFEVMVLVKPDPDIYSPFAGNIIHQFPVYLFSHEETDQTVLGNSLKDFMADVMSDWQSDHLTQIIIQLGVLLEKYSQTVPPAITK
jgi:hypothetical protein